jgi:Xaa-Pro aminopeptidase
MTVRIAGTLAAVPVQQPAGNPGKGQLAGVLVFYLVQAPRTGGASADRQNLARPLAIAVHLRDQRIETVEARLGAQIFDQRHRKMLAIEIGIEIEDMHFQVRKILAEHRPHAEAGDALVAAAIGAGSETWAMEPLVSSGPRSGLPHMTWRRRILEQGDGLFIEMAASHARYHAGLMRSVWLGTPPDAAQTMMACAEEALAAALAECRPGRHCSAPHEAAQAVIDAAGHSAAFRKRIGYSMGVAFAPDWGEGNILSLFTGVTREMEMGMVFHLPATLREYGQFTVGVSETVIITETGCETLSTLPRAMTIA